MTRTQIEARAALLATFEGWADVTPAPDWTTLVNRAWHQFSWDSECNVTTETIASVANQCQYATAKYYRTVLAVIYDGTGLARSSEEFELYLAPGFPVAAGGTPARWALANFGQLFIIPPPSAVKNIVVTGSTEAADLAAGSDIPACPESFHEAIAIRACWMQGMAYANETALARLNLLEARYQEYVQKSRNTLLHAYRRKEPGEP